MDNQPASISFAAIGHQDNWDNIHRFVTTLQIAGNNQALSLQQIKEVYRFIPPRKVFDVKMYSPLAGAVNGIYIETFISPDELDMGHLHANLKKVREACDCAVMHGIDIVSLGGFTSIILETASTSLDHIGKTFFTTGNTLTAAFIAKSIESVCKDLDRSLTESNLLIVGSTGDIGSACAGYFAGSVKKLLLCARNTNQLSKQAQFFEQQNFNATASVNLNDLLPMADIAICVASSMLPECNIDLLPANAIICDAGYPKNLVSLKSLHERKLFAGGLGLVKKGFQFTPDHKKDIYNFSDNYIVHGCLLESIVLAMENTPKAFSTGRGNITRKAMNEIIDIAAKHGIEPVPIFN